MTQKNKTKILFLFFVSVPILMFIILDGRKAEKDWNTGFARFDSSNLDGTISEIITGRGLTSFKMKGYPSEYDFSPIKSKLTDEKDFEYEAVVGDRIYKLAFSDTLILFKNASINIYTFDRSMFGDGKSKKLCK